MKRLWSFLILDAIAGISAIIGAAQQHPALMYAGIIGGGFLVLALAVYLTRFIWRLIGYSLSSFLFLVAIGTITGFLTFNGLVQPILSFFIGIGLGMLMLFVIFRKLANLAQRSMVFGEAFSFISGYGVRAFIERERKTMITKESKTLEDNDSKNIIALLKDMGFSYKEAKDRAGFAIAQTKVETPLEDKVEIALRYGQQN